MTTRNILICIDGSSCANYAFRWAVENLLREFDHVILLHATRDFKNLEPSMSDSKKEWPPEAIHAYEEKVVEQAKTLTSQYISTLGGSGNISHEAVISKGDPRSIIMENIEKYAPSAVVMGSRGMGVLKRVIVGSVSDFILHNSNAPVIVVREGNST